MSHHSHNEESEFPKAMTYRTVAQMANSHNTLWNIVTFAACIGVGGFVYWLTSNDSTESIVQLDTTWKDENEDKETLSDKLDRVLDLFEKQNEADKQKSDDSIPQWAKDLQNTTNTLKTEISELRNELKEIILGVSVNSHPPQGLSDRVASLKLSIHKFEESLSNLSSEAKLQSCNTMIMFIKNLGNNKNTSQFQKIKTSNPMYRKHLSAIDGHIQVFKAVGMVLINDTFEWIWNNGLVNNPCDEDITILFDEAIKLLEEIKLNKKEINSSAIPSFDKILQLAVDGPIDEVKS